MKFLTLIVAITLLTACQLVRPFGKATTYKPFTVSPHPGLEGRYHCMRSALDAEGYEVEYIFPERDTPNFFDISRGSRLIAQSICLIPPGQTFWTLRLSPVRNRPMKILPVS